ncbi:MAG: hypothetical protein SO267_02375 [Lachnospiraceae bacterium]|nr:hypothetical protein [Lachnospiraceae bacterium]
MILMIILKTKNKKKLITNVFMPPSVTFSKGWRGHDSVLEDFKASPTAKGSGFLPITNERVLSLKQISRGQPRNKGHSKQTI